MTIHLSDIEWRRLARYLAGECDVVEATAVERWISADAERAADVDALRQVIALRGVGVELSDVDGARERFEARLQEYLPQAAGVERESSTLRVNRSTKAAEKDMQRQINGNDGNASRMGRQKGLSDMTGRLGTRTLRRWGWSIGAVVAASVILLSYRSERTDRSDAAQRYTTNNLQRATLTLDDGTRATLAPRTTLRVAHFSAQARTVILDGGEAYFAVAASPGAPFIVQSGTTTMRVLGTEFLVRHDLGTSHVRIAVADGKVRITTRTHADADVTLTAGQIGDVTDSVTHISTVDDIAPGTEWLHGRLLFHDTPVATVLETLSRWYGYQFKCADPALPQKSVTIMVSVQSSAAALATLEQILNVNLTVVGDTVTLFPQSRRHGKGRAPTRTYDVFTPIREVGR